MSELFDDISRIVGSPIPRRRAIRAVGGAVLGAFLGASVFRRLGSAQTATTCCRGLGGSACVFQGQVVCGRDAFTQERCESLGGEWRAGHTCCLDSHTCASPQVCCGATCCDSTNSVCLNDACCPTNRVCGNSTICCPSGTICAPGTQECCPVARFCPGNQTCCPSGTVCVNEACCPSERVCTNPTTNQTICCSSGRCCGGTKCCSSGVCTSDGMNCGGGGFGGPLISPSR
ncbi:MAG TPA: hypothetical protein VF668_05310 [Pyrinomonadaceae bacterium]